MAHRNYSQELRDEAVARIVEGGESATAVARELSVTVATVRRWVVGAHTGVGDGAGAGPDQDGADLNDRLTDALRRISDLEDRVRAADTMRNTTTSMVEHERNERVETSIDQQPSR